MPGALTRLGLDYAWGRKVNQRIIYCSVKGFLPGPYSDRPFLDELAQMAGGLAYLTGFENQPMRAGASITDIGAATYGVVGILAALYRREQTGEGDSIESRALRNHRVLDQPVHHRGADDRQESAAARHARERHGRRDGLGRLPAFPHERRQAGVHRRHRQPALGGVVRRARLRDWKKSPEFDNNRKRGAEKRRIAERITEAVAKLTYDDITERLYKALVPYAPVGTPLDILDDRQMNEGKRWLPLKIGDKEFKVPKLPISMAGTRDFAMREQAGTLGAHTDSILAELGYSAAEIEALKSQKVVLRSDRMLNIDDPE